MAVVWITGASSGLGMYTARALKRDGHAVVCGARSFIGREGESDEGYRLPLDVTDERSMDAFCRRAKALYGDCEVLINAAAMLVLGACEGYTREELVQVIATDFLSQASMIARVLPAMRENRRGRIVNFSSINGLLGIPFEGAYTAAKHAVEGYSEALAMEVAPFGVEVMLVEPGDHKGGKRAYRPVSSGMTEAHPYRRFQRGVDRIARDEENGLSPERLGQKIASVLRRKRLPFRLIVAKPDQRLAVVLHDILPARLFFSIISSYYNKPSA